MNKNELKCLRDKIAEEDDQHALNILMRHFAPSLYHFANSFVRNPQEAEEIVSDVFVKSWQHRNTLPEAFYLKYYLFKAVKNTAFNYLKSNGRRTNCYQKWELEVSHINRQTPEDIVISKEQMDTIGKAIETLPPRCRQIFTLVKEEGMSYAQVADLLEISIATVNVQITIALKKIWNILDPQLHISRS